MSWGFVYVLANPVMPGIYKVGYTERSPSLRCEELSRSTSVPCEFELVCYAEYENARDREQEIHAMLCDLRLSSNREFFRGDLKIISDLVMDEELCLSFFNAKLPHYLFTYSPMYRNEIDPAQFPKPEPKAKAVRTGLE
ncbi:GIY-YIG nuclease family protein [Burkholderia multivorans]|uniref:GIY-YIG nuclease family protein n=1 Tax=Burkholderia multivorans TaxID=87883 RepID=UPI000CFECCAC|nr:GIY-YIG nuclease family protein [Burkholderia multivorans]PRE27553.1 hypothetical protein C6P79_14620 [Burkholderia multivorans]QGR60410.1 GIY-YIG nuclease family protein [Burkholderia multivorans]UQP01373.1 GIY-YIG nuclease family protein [Burkholderia multivorans]